MLIAAARIAPSGEKARPVAGCFPSTVISLTLRFFTVSRMWITLPSEIASNAGWVRGENAIAGPLPLPGCAPG